MQSFLRLHGLIARSLLHRRSRRACVCAYVHLVCVCVSSQKYIAIHMLHKTPFNCVQGLRQRISASNPYGPPHTLYKCHICCVRITQHMKYLTQHMTKIHTTYDKKLRNIYEFLRQHVNFLTQHMKISCTTHVNNL